MPIYYLVSSSSLLSDYTFSLEVITAFHYLLWLLVICCGLGGQLEICLNLTDECFRMHEVRLSRGFDEEWAVEETMQEFDDRVSNAVCVEVEGAKGFWSSKRFTNIFLPIGISLVEQRFIREAPRGKFQV